MLPRPFALSLSDKVASMQRMVPGLSAAQSGGHTLLAVPFRHKSEDGPRSTARPVELIVDGRNERTFRVALHSGREAVVNIPLHLTAGLHQIQVADRKTEVHLQK